MATITINLDGTALEGASSLRKSIVGVQESVTNLQKVLPQLGQTGAKAFANITQSVTATNKRLVGTNTLLSGIIAKTIRLQQIGTDVISGATTNRGLRTQGFSGRSINRGIADAIAFGTGAGTAGAVGGVRVIRGGGGVNISARGTLSQQVADQVALENSQLRRERFESSQRNQGRNIENQSQRQRQRGIESRRGRVNGLTGRIVGQSVVGGAVGSRVGGLFGLGITGNVGADVGLIITAGSLFLGGRFEEELSRISAIRNLSPSQSGNLSQGIRGLASRSRFTPTQSATAVENLVRGGLSTNRAIQTLQSIIPLALVNRGGTLAGTSNILLDLLARFPSQFSNQGGISQASDLLIGTLAGSRLTAGDLQTNLRYFRRLPNSPNNSLPENLALQSFLAGQGVFGSSNIRPFLRGIRNVFSDPERSATALGIGEFGFRQGGFAGGSVVNASRGTAIFLSRLSQLIQGNGNGSLTAFQRNAIRRGTRITPSALGSAESIAASLSRSPEFANLNGNQFIDLITQRLVASSEGAGQNVLNARNSTLGGAFTILGSRLEDLAIGTVIDDNGRTTRFSDAFTNSINLTSGVLSGDFSQYRTAERVRNQVLIPDAFGIVQPENRNRAFLNGNIINRATGRVVVRGLQRSLGSAGFNDAQIEAVRRRARNDDSLLDRASLNISAGTIIGAGVGSIIPGIGTAIGAIGGAIIGGTLALSEGILAYNRGDQFNRAVADAFTDRTQANQRRADRRIANLQARRGLIDRALATGFAFPSLIGPRRALPDILTDQDRAGLEIARRNTIEQEALTNARAGRNQQARDITINQLIDQQRELRNSATTNDQALVTNSDTQVALLQELVNRTPLPDDSEPSAPTRRNFINE